MKQKSIASFFQAKPSKEAPASVRDAAAAKKGDGPSAAQPSKPSVPADAHPETVKKSSPDVVKDQSGRSGPSAAKKASPATGSKKVVAAVGKQDASTPAPAGAQPAAAGPSSDTPSGEALVGCRVKVFWPNDKAWYKGDVTKYDSSNGKHHVEYDDGEAEWLDLAREQFQVVPGAKKAAKKPAGRRAAVLLSDDDDDEEEEEADDSGSEYAGSMEADSESESMDLEAEGDDDDGGSEVEKGLEDEDVEVAGKRKAGGKAAASRKQAKTSAAATPSGRTAAEPGSQATPATAAKATPATAAKATPAPGINPMPRPTPGTHAKSSMKKALQVEASTIKASGRPAEECVVLGVKAPLNSETARFMERMATKFDFLHPDRIRDAAKRRPSDPSYDPRSVHIPDDWFKRHKVSDGQQQWWRFKAQNFDSVLLFKMGKFYEMFEMDAYVGVDVLGLSFMKGDQPHAGFPEVGYHGNAERLARAGYRVVVVEQTETPEQLKERNERLKASGRKQDKVVARDKVAVLTRGTLTDAEMVVHHPDAAYVMALLERPCEEEEARPMEVDGGEAGQQGPRPEVRLGVCVVDVASCQVMLGQFEDDEVRSRLRTQLTALQPVELVLPGTSLSATTAKVLRVGLREPQVNRLRASGWSGPTCVRALEQGQYWQEGAWPDMLQAMTGSPTEHGLALGALELMAGFLKDGLLDRAVLPLGRFEPLLGCGADGTAEAAAATAAASAEPFHMHLNGSALQSLEVVENTAGGTHGTLLAVLNHCVTPFGRRRLRQWLCQPLYRVEDISRRQDAVQELLGPAGAAVSEAKRKLAGVSDLERAIARLHASTVAGASGRDAANVVLYEDGAKRKVRQLLAALRDMQAVHAALEAFRDTEEAVGSEALLALVGPGRWQELGASLQELLEATDWQQAEETGRVIPAKGVDAAYDEATSQVGSCEKDLAAYLKEVREQLGAGKEVTYCSLNKDSHLIEVPESLVSRVPRGFDLAAQRKGYKRYSSARLKELVAELAEAQAGVQDAASSILQGLVRRFVSRKALWMSAVHAVAELDALMSLATAAVSSDGPMCRPVFHPTSDNGGFIRAGQLRHPAGITGRDSTFVANDMSLGGACPGFLLLTGPNMGGKSTLLRQVCLAAILAQVGGHVPAESFELTAMDAVFVRMGAQDAIMAGQSTFFVELAETAAMLAHATHRSLIALDELGRGTATLDGAAIAAAVLEQLAQETRCCGLFATHYHQLAEQHAADPQVAIMHMGCDVSSGKEGGEEVTFLYKLTRGACPRSYGTNVAKLAGLPATVVSRAAEISARRTSCALGSAIMQAQQLCKVCGDGSKSGVDMLTVMQSIQSSLVQ